MSNDTQKTSFSLPHPCGMSWFYNGIISLIMRDKLTLCPHNGLVRINPAEGNPENLVYKVQILPKALNCHSFLKKKNIIQG